MADFSYPSSEIPEDIQFYQLSIDGHLIEHVIGNNLETTAKYLSSIGYQLARSINRDVLDGYTLQELIMDSFNDADEDGLNIIILSFEEMIGIYEEIMEP